MEGPSRRRQAWAWGCLSFCFPQLRACRVGAIPVDGCNCCNSLERSPPPPQATAATAATAAPATAAISPSSPQLFARGASAAATAGPRTGLVPGGAHARASCCAAMWSRPRTGFVPGGDGRKYREVWPAKSGVAVVHPAPNPLTISQTHVGIYQEEAEERHKTHPKIGCRRTPPSSPSMGARCLLRRPLSAPGWPRPGAAVPRGGEGGFI